MAGGAGDHPADGDTNERERLNMPSGQPVRKDEGRVKDPDEARGDPRGPGFESGQAGRASKEEREKTRPREEH
ncbi:hypothetical protein [Lutibaculum baratangense]|uniref:Uncharacterized protein n=1 Tax=Lutibaculum baratangense AMV1 TaxID=631454 RepID=V4RLN8_9HYPH|nr:hypothetical protein [Lutibaculum baratangense]ESR26926.1 hypothetical protein N177_0710 [Lutibaculum baratangense AMV1]